MKKLILILFIIFSLTSCLTNNYNEKQEKKVSNYDNLKKDKQENYRIILNKDEDIIKINDYTLIIDVDYSLWEKSSIQILKEVLKYNYFNKNQPFLIEIIGKGDNRYYKLSMEEAKLFKDIKSEVVLLFYVNGEYNGKEKGIVTCDNEVKKLLESNNVYICGK